MLRHGGRPAADRNPASPRRMEWAVGYRSSFDARALDDLHPFAHGDVVEPDLRLACGGFSRRQHGSKIFRAEMVVEVFHGVPLLDKEQRVRVVEVPVQAAIGATWLYAGRREQGHN